MATDPKKQGRKHRQTDPPDGLVTWLLGALGVYWAARIAIRAFRRRERLSLTQAGEHRGSPIVPLPRPTRGHEARDANPKWIFGIVLFLLVFGLGIHGILAWFLSALKHSSSAIDNWRPVKGVVQATPGRARFPVLQVSPAVELQAFRVREEVELQTYGWVNRTSGIVRIPIERAMELVLQNGLPARTNDSEDLPGPSSYQLIQRRLERREPEVHGEK